MDRGYLRRHEAAEYLGVSPRTIGNWMNRRVIPYYKMSQGIVLFSKVELDAALKKYRVRAVGEEL
jgi:excisionase family DNA binding protein